MTFLAQRRRDLAFFSVFLLLFTAGCELIGTNSPAEKQSRSAYPTTYPVLSPDHLSDLRKSFRGVNANTVCTPLDSFGFADWEITNCLDGDFFHPGDTIDQYPGLVVQNAKRALKTYSAFTGVTDTTRLAAANVNDSQVKFQHQHYEGLEVKRTQLIVDQNDGGVFALGGNWYPNIVIPDQDEVSIQEAQRSLIGEKLTWYSFGGETRTFEITDESFPEEASATKLILPVEYEDRTALHVVWQVEIFGMFDNSPAWYIYVDTTTGEKLHTEQLFQT